jgi:amino acid efflux transporter
VRAGFGLAEGVFGAGLLLVPPMVAGLAGAAAPAAWLVHLAVGSAFSLALGLFAHAGGVPRSIAQVTGAALGRRAGRTVLALYLTGFTVGQAAIALAAGGFAAVGAGSAGTRGAVVAGCLLLAAATAAAALGIRLTDRGRRLRLAVTAALAVYGCARPGWFAAAHLLPDRPHWFAWAVFLAFFAGVGWESSTRIAPGLASRRQVTRAVALGATLVGLGYVGLALLLRARSPTASMAPDGLDRVAALAAAAVLAGYCLTNLPAAGRFALALRPAAAGTPAGAVRPPVVPMVLVGTVGIGLVLLAATAGWTPARLLVGPCLATWAGYLLAMLGTARAGTGPERLVAGLVTVTMIGLLVVVVGTIP